MLCGDEVGGVVADVGTLNCRFGASGQESPRHVFRTSGGRLDAQGSSSSGSGSGSSNSLRRRDRFTHDEKALRCISHDVINMEIEPLIMANNEINYDLIPSIMSHGVEGCMRMDISNFPVLFPENCFKTDTSKQKLLEILFEEVGLSSLYVPKTAMLGSFCYGKATSLVVDIGASHTTISPVVDGYVLEKSVVTTPRGGNWLNGKVAEVLAKNNISVAPWYEKPGQRGGVAASAALSSPMPVRAPASFRAMHVADVVQDLKQWMCFLSLSAHSPAAAAGQDPAAMASFRVQHMPAYELPDGTLVPASQDLCLAADSFFRPGRTRTPTHSSSSSSSSSLSVSKASHSSSSSSAASILSSPHIMTMPSYAQPMDLNTQLDPLHELVFASLAMCDIDCRKELAANIVLIGGGTLLDGLQARLQADLASLLPGHMKPKVSNLLPMEQAHAAWIGGSILSICGTFQQMWLSREQYTELGAAALLKRAAH